MNQPACCSAIRCRPAASTWRCMPGSARRKTCPGRSCTRARSLARRTASSVRTQPGSTAPIWIAGATRWRSSSILISERRCGPRRSAFTRPSCRRCRSTSARMCSSCRNGCPGCARPATSLRRRCGSPIGPPRRHDPMIRFTTIRLVEIAAMLALMSFVIYALIGLMPGDPIDLMRSADPRMSAADAARLKALYGVDQPLVTRYAAWAREALAGELGYSRLFAAPVSAALLPRLGNSLLLMGSSFALAFALALGLGIAAARRPNSWLDAGINLFSFAAVSMPTFWLALLFIIVFAAELGWLPAGGIAADSGGGLADRAQHPLRPGAAPTLGPPRGDA